MTYHPVPDEDKHPVAKIRVALNRGDPVSDADLRLAKDFLTDTRRYFMSMDATVVSQWLLRELLMVQDIIDARSIR